MPRLDRKTSLKCVALIPILAFLCVPERSRAEDWPQWNGPRRDGTLDASRLSATIPSSGLKRLWSQPVSLGYAGPVVADGKVFVLDYLKESGSITNNAGKRDVLTGMERASCFDAATGEKLWQYQYQRPYAVSYGGGPRATPIVKDSVLYLLGSEGDLVALETSSGTKLWQRQFNEEFGAKTPLWGHSASPLVFEETLVCMVGGEGSLVVAFDLKTGEERWRALSSEETGYCPPTLFKHAGVEQLLVWSPTEISSLNPRTGETYWQEPLQPDYGMSILPPIMDGNLLYTSGEGSKSIMLRLSESSTNAEVVWTGEPKRGLFLATSNGIFHQGHLYGADIRSGALICARGNDGQRLWQTALPTTGSKRGRGGAHASAFMVRLIGEGHPGNEYFILSETGAMIAAVLTPEGYEETGRFQAIEPMLKTMGRTVLWTYPAIADGRLYLRNDAELLCYELAKTQN
ncbi:MAG: PQQ-binding-like beta-propeller repeat protein [Planctomycetota bacterium]